MYLSQILTCMCCHGDGKGFSCSYSDGSVVNWSRKSETKPEKIFFPHGELLRAIIALFRLSYAWGEETVLFCVCSVIGMVLSTFKLSKELTAIELH